MIGEGVYLLVMERNFDTALKAWEVSAPNAVEERARLAARAAIHLFAGNAMRAQDEIRQGRELVGSRVEAQPDDVIALIQLSWINLAAKREADALRLAQRALELLPPEKDAVAGAAILAGLAEIEAQTGHAEEAIKTLQHCLSIPAGISVSIARLKIDPVWDPIRKNPQFQQLLTIKERVGP
jgi:tetratricopeptide (TPR) repeat protein